MAVSPEQEKQAGIPPEISHVQESFSPEIEKRLQEIGAQVRPVSPQQVTDDKGQVIAQPTDDTQGGAKTVQIKAAASQAKVWSKGSISDSRTWLGVVIIRTIKQALHNGWQIIVGVKN